MIIESIKKRPLADELKSRIFDPLGMTHTFLWKGIPSPAIGVPRAHSGASLDYETTDWNMSQSGAAGGVVSNVEDMHGFVESLLSGMLFKSPDTLIEMKETVPTTNFTLLGYGTGLATKGESLWGHGGQTLG